MARTSDLSEAGVDREPALDAVRGVAVLGILAMNVRNFGLPLREFDNPRFPRGVEGAGLEAGDFWVWVTSNVLAEDKMITIFGLLFGAGVVLLADRIERAGSGRGAWLHYRRMLWLLVIGLGHAYLLWYGDILNTYALCGLLLWPMRRLGAPVLIGLGAAVFVVTVWLRVGPGMWEMVSGEASWSMPGSGLQRRIMGEAMRTEEAAYRGSWLDLATWRANLNTAWHFTAGASFSLWRSLGHMLIGMGLMRLGMFTGAGRAGTYLWGALAAYSVGLTLTLIGAAPTIAEVLGRGVEAEGVAARALGRMEWTMRFVGALGVALGHVCVVLGVWRGVAGARVVLHPLACVGRMALSSYLMQTMVCVLVFDGWAGGQWDRWRMGEMYLLVAGVWVVQLVVSPLWLRVFRFGPAEWAWRSLTYWRLQGMRRGAG